MNFEKALEVLKEERKQSKVFNLFAVDKAIESLKKQKPKKVVEGEADTQMGYYCPSCNEELIENGEWDYCMFCGQALEWGDAYEPCEEPINTTTWDGEPINIWRNSILGIGEEKND